MNDIDTPYFDFSFLRASALFTINPHARQHNPQPTSCIAPTQYASQKAAEDHLAGAPFKSLASKGKEWFSAPPVISFSEELGQGAGSRL